MPILRRTSEPVPLHMGMPQTPDPIAYAQPLPLRKGSRPFQLNLDDQRVLIDRARRIAAANGALD
ncbi:hypothetical protein HPB48_022439 [Haemaphysalis longicornis]|uniref:Uncharacterized protein n=1 Tax=Haemaphysalis longicornis TaxID=44386 RepID=A0A9J6FUC1_HAELO|nr:hypothetical protein HPB48_022439 [Haemaphysalis longicornis]